MPVCACVGALKERSGGTANKYLSNSNVTRKTK